MSAFINGLRVNANGRADTLLSASTPIPRDVLLRPELAATTYDALLSVIRVSNGLSGQSPYVFTAGFMYDKNGSLQCTTASPRGTIWHNGLRFAASGALYVSNIVPIASYVHGWPVGVNGEVCINDFAPPPPADPPPLALLIPILIGPPIIP